MGGQSHHMPWPGTGRLLASFPCGSLPCAARRVDVAKDKLTADGPWQQALMRLSRHLRRRLPDSRDLRGVTRRPLQAAYLSPEQPFVIDLPARWCRGLHALAFPLVPGQGHPFVDTVQDILSSVTRYDDSALCAYYARTRPATAADVLGLQADDLHPDLRLPPLAATLPWEFRTPAEALVFWQRICADDYRQHGFALTASDGWKAWGPVSAAAGAAEFTRLTRLCAAIRLQGYRRHPAGDGDIRGIILQRGQATRILLTAGQHRAAVLAGLGMSQLPLRLTAAIVRRDDVLHWPNLRRGIFAPNQALQVFDRIFAGLPPACAASLPKPGLSQARRSV
jgi:hypothetical protein